MSCKVCHPPVGWVPSSSPALDDAAMRLARSGASAHEIAHVMQTWAADAAERAIVWAEREDARYAAEDAQAAADAQHCTDYIPEEDR